MPALAGIYVNFADLYRHKGRDDEAESMLRQGLAAAPRDPGIHYALGLTLVRQKRMPAALKELERAATLPPERSDYVYVYGVALDSAGQTDRALEVLAGAHAGHPGNREILLALASLNAKARRWAAAVGYAKKLVELDPQDPEARQIYDQLTGKHAPSDGSPPAR
jgi:Flp pilus assembly protein TadD